MKSMQIISLQKIWRLISKNDNATKPITHFIIIHANVVMLPPVSSTGLELRTIILEISSPTGQATGRETRTTNEMPKYV